MSEQPSGTMSQQGDEPLLALQTQRLWDSVNVRIKFVDKTLGGLPAGGKPLDYFVKSKMMSEAEEADFRSRLKAGNLTDEERAEMEDTSCTVFERDADGHLCVWCGNIKAMLRESCTSLAYTQAPYLKLAGADIPKQVETPTICTGGRNVVQHCLNVFPLRPKFLLDGKPMTEASGTLDRIKHISGPSGERSAIGRHEYIEGATLEFSIRWPRRSNTFTREDIMLLLALAQTNGLSASRSQSYGRFQVTNLVWDTGPASERPVKASKPAGKRGRPRKDAEADAENSEESVDAADEGM